LTEELVAHRARSEGGHPPLLAAKAARGNGITKAIDVSARLAQAGQKRSLPVRKRQEVQVILRICDDASVGARMSDGADRRSGVVRENQLI